MKKNMGKTDKTVRLTVALALIAMYYLDILTGKLGVVALIIAVVFMLSTLIGFCPLYTLFGINTCKNK
ncbi:MAG: DUF2892 domain-containing protein [Flavobacteriales bacterium]|nr:DUF2892 domain-containing protein [Flavobacteriales bacterium]